MNLYLIGWIVSGILTTVLLLVENLKTGVITIGDLLTILTLAILAPVILPIIIISRISDYENVVIYRKKK